MILLTNTTKLLVMWHISSAVGRTMLSCNTKSSQSYNEHDTQYMTIKPAKNVAIVVMDADEYIEQCVSIASIT